MRIETGNFCPLVNGECKKFECKFWVQLRGTNPQTGEEIDDYDCTISYLPTLILEAAQQARQAGAAVESFRNENIVRTEQLTNALLEAQKIVPAIVSTQLNTKGILGGQ